MVAKSFFANATRAVNVPFALFFSLAPLTLAANASASVLNAQWQNYVAQEFQIAVGVEPTQVSFTNESTTLAGMIRSALQRDLTAALKISDSTILRVELREGSSGLYDSPGLGLVRQSYGFARGQQITPTVVRQIGAGEIHVGGIFTYENFSQGGLGSSNRPASSASESSGGSALVVGWRGALDPQWGAFVSAQSRMHMDEFRSYRGLFTEAGRFDLPGRVRAGLNYAVAPRSSLEFSAERVNYAAVKPFASRLLPDRFVSLLGDSASPTFAWQDLTIYRVGLDQQLSSREMLSLEVSTSLQPEPTSARLRNALSDGVSDYVVSVGYERKFFENSRLRVGASYLPFSYFFGPTLLSSDRDYSGTHLEAEALFEVTF